MKRNKDTSTIIIKLISIILFFVLLSPNGEVLTYLFKLDYSKMINLNSAYPQNIINSLVNEIDPNNGESLLVSKMYLSHEIEEIPIEDDIIIPDTPDQNDDENNGLNNDSNNIPSNPTNAKRIYIYSTHQSEEYANSNVIEGSKYLRDKLQELGYEVILEENDFIKYLNNNNLNYNQSYVASRYYYQLALKKYGSFDFVIDFHRDSVNKEISTLSVNGKSYAKLMHVPGTLSSNYNYIYSMSEILTSSLNSEVNGICRNVFIRESRYNQDLQQNSILLEVGGPYNTYDEIKNSLDVYAKILTKYLGG